MLCTRGLLALTAAIAAESTSMEIVVFIAINHYTTRRRRLGPSLQTMNTIPFPCAVIIHIRFIGYNLSRAKELSTPNSIANIILISSISKEEYYGFQLFLSSEMQNRFASEYSRPLQYRMLPLCYCYHKCHRYYGNGYTDNDIGGQWFSEHDSADQYCRDRFEDSQN